MPHHVGFGEVMDRDPLNAGEDTLDLKETTVFAARQVNLRLVTSDHRARIHAKPRQEHFHLRAGGILRLVEDDERVRQRPSTHIGERRDLNHARFEGLLHTLAGHHVLQRVVQRPEVGIHLGLHVAREKSERFTSLDRRPREHNPLDPLTHQCVDGCGDGEIGLACTGRPDPEYDVVLENRLQVCGLPRRLSLHDLADSWQDEPRADRRVAARLSPTLESLASELETELGKTLGNPGSMIRLDASHGFAVAAFIASGMADVGFGVQTAAERFKLDFIPLIRERYFFAVTSESLEQAPMQQVVDVLRSDNFSGVVNQLPGYDGSDTGTILTLNEAFGGSRKNA